MSTLDEVGERDAWRCWLCDEPVDRGASANADRGPSVDSGAAPKGKKAAAPPTEDPPPGGAEALSAFANVLLGLGREALQRRQRALVGRVWCPSMPRGMNEITNGLLCQYFPS